jgi:hypothetical protein
MQQQIKFRIIYENTIQISHFDIRHSIFGVRYSTWALPPVEAAQAFRSYCAGLSHKPVSAPIPNAEPV